jgi:hypothetical protein
MNESEKRMDVVATRVRQQILSSDFPIFEELEIRRQIVYLIQWRIP